MASGESEQALATVYAKLAEAEARHAGVWEAKLREAKAWTGPPSPSWRARLLSFLARRGAVALVAQTMAGAEARDRTMYDDQPEAGVALPREERSHARLLREAGGASGASGAAIARLEGRHRMGGGNALRAAVLGVNDGLVSNFSLVMGVAGAGGDARAVMVAGAAGLLAGSLSMALGEWLSVQSARELYSHQIAVEKEELEAAPEEEEEELALIYQAKGAKEEQARAMARQIVRGDSGSALDALAREELAIDPAELGGSAYVASGTSFAMFALGAIVPLLPHLVATGTAAIAASAVVSGLALFGVGALITVITGQGAVRAGTRQLLIGIAAAAVTYGLGRLFGAAIA
ncbi:MAG: VIT1/CCC1 transporter family protein [Chloroflexota bacterium]|nr:VIT1/CCC1 transporter family protein [Chloroflexota bacterium]MDE3103375.1 VIT1/CCC1 transporter family protein [Chloroflexota bacterium]